MNPRRSVSLIYSFATGVLYMVGGILLILNRNNFQDLSDVIPIMGGACLLYGGFRLWRGVYLARQARREDAYDNLTGRRGV